VFALAQQSFHSHVCEELLSFFFVFLLSRGRRGDAGAVLCQCFMLCTKLTFKS